MARDEHTNNVHILMPSELDTGKISDTAKKIIEEFLPEWLEYFLKKNAGYGDMHHDLGLRAQFVDINRKVGKLRRAWWEGKNIGDENAREVLMDLIGHCFLSFELLADGDPCEQLPEWE